MFQRLKDLIFSPNLLSSAICVLMAFGVTSIFMLIIKVNPLVAYIALFSGAFGSVRRLSEVLVRMCPLLLTSLAVAIPFKCGVINLGAEGQLYFGAIIATIIGLTLLNFPSAILIPIIIVACFLIGAFWAFIPALLKTKLKINEVITTIMLNYIPILLTDYLSMGPLKEEGGMLPETALISDAARLPILIPGTRTHGGIIIAIICAALAYIFLWRTPLGYEIRVTGSSSEAAQSVGIDATKCILLSMVIGGGFAGLAGMGEICGIQWRLKSGISPGFGFTGVIVALLGNLNPLAIVPASFFLSALFVGAGAMQRGTGVPVAIVYILQALVVIFVLAREIIIEKMRLRQP